MKIRSYIAAATAAICWIGASYSLPALSQNPICDPEPPPNFEQPIFTAMNSEAFTLDTISVLPLPPPSNKSYKETLALADTFGQIGENVMAIRGLSLRAGIPFPPPGEGTRGVLPLPPPNALLAQANQILRRTDGLLQLAEVQIEAAFDSGSISPAAYDALLGALVVLNEQIGLLPVPPPNPDIPGT